MSYFLNRCGDHTETDNALLSELRYAGIPSIWDVNRVAPSNVAPIKKVIREGSGHVKTSTYGDLYGWTFTRFPKYWEAKGPGIDVDHAEILHSQHGSHVRVGGDGTAPSPMKHYRGLACGYYHVDTFEGLRALADTIKLIVEGPKPTKIFGIVLPTFSDIHNWLARS